MKDFVQFYLAVVQMNNESLKKKSYQEISSQFLLISDNQPMEFGGIISTSNCLDESPQIHVKTDKPLVWTLGIKM